MKVSQFHERLHVGLLLNRDAKAACALKNCGPLIKPIPRVTELVTWFHYTYSCFILARTRKTLKEPLY